jgi:hypothetical protein
MANGLFYQCMSWYDAWWRRRHRVERFDELISFSFERFSGERRVMNDGTCIEPGDALAILHFNRECFSGPLHQSRDYMRNALRFRKLILASLARLANEIHRHEKLMQVKAFHGISWLPPHGEKLGFVIEPLPDSALTRVRQFYFRLLLRAFFPQVAARESKRIRPHAYWLTRQNLLAYFSKECGNHEIQPEYR